MRSASTSPTVARRFAEVVNGGALHRLLLGGDVARSSRYRSYGGLPGLDYLPRRFLPRLMQQLGGEAVRTVLVDNPATLLSCADPSGMSILSRAPEGAASSEGGST